MRRHLQLLLLLSSNYSCIRYRRGQTMIERNIQKASLMKVVRMAELNNKAMAENLLPFFVTIPCIIFGNFTIVR